MELQINNKKTNYVYISLALQPKTYIKDSYIHITTKSFDDITFKDPTFKLFQYSETEIVFLNITNVKKVVNLINIAAVEFKNGKSITLKSDQFLKNLEANLKG